MRSGHAFFKQTALVFGFIWFFVIPLNSLAFYDWQGENSEVSLRGFASLAGAIRRNPSNNVFFAETADAFWDSSLRLLADAKIGPHVYLESNALQIVRSIPESAVSQRNRISTGVERSSILTWLQHDTNNSEGRFVIDSLSGSVITERADVVLGRQPINLATTFYFTPNDFFAPFAAQDFFRVYKPGVDGARAEIRLGNLTQLSLIGVLGYDPDPSTANGWSDEPDFGRISLVARIATSRAGFEWALLGGTIRDSTIAGGSLQGELWDWLGVRAEGHYAFAEDDQVQDAGAVTLGLEHRFPNSLTVRFEQFYQEKGFQNIGQVNEALAAGRLDVFYLGKQYSAFDISYEFSPLLLGEVLVLNNWSDHSQLISVNTVYSLSDESEMNIVFSLPLGDTPEGARLKSEFGSAPIQGFLEFRFFF